MSLNAIEFFKDFGIVWAKEILSESLNCGTYVDSNINVTCHMMQIEPQPNKSGGYVFRRDELESLVESWELVESFFNLNSLGFEKCIEIANKQIEELESNGAIEFWHRWDDELSCTVARMKKAIEDVESVGCEAQ
ncbi:hypothetical protein [Acinetobacter bereziniae]|uniref:hypothetical protein n=1 Tax=Acinetobacter bereziniae TaxID=106648 RepID=UPI00124F9D3F|nr:hypothetical protein [Acinetobacter bereziniae]